MSVVGGWWPLKSELRALIGTRRARVLRVTVSERGVMANDQIGDRMKAQYEGNNYVDSSVAAWDDESIMRQAA